MDTKKTQKIVVVVLVVTALLGIVGALLVYYLSIDDVRDIDIDDKKEYCACITAYTTPDCNDCSCTRIENQALDSKIGEVVDGSCTLDCNEALPEQEEKEETIECLIKNVRLDSCHSVNVRDTETRELIIPPVPVDRPVLVSGTFVPKEIGGEVEDFTGFKFIINGVTQEVDVEEVNTTNINGQETYIPEIEFSNFQDASTLTVQAISYSDRDPEGGSPNKYCHRKYDLTTDKTPVCTGMTAQETAGEEPNTTIIERIELNTPSLIAQENISIEFIFDSDEINNVNMEEIPEEALADETITLEYEDLYATPELYVREEGFPVLDANILSDDIVEISAQIFVNDALIDTNLCRDNIELLTEAEIDPDPDPDQVTLTIEGHSCIRPVDEEDEESRANYRITVINESETQENITEITAYLPLGFRYANNSTVINGTSVEDDILELTSLGESQELSWTGDWTVSEQSSFTLEYGVDVTAITVEGNNYTEARVMPINETAEFVTEVSQECELDEGLPETGIIRITSLIIGITILIIGLLTYQGKLNSVNQALFKVTNTKAFKKTTMSPQDYFEDSILEKEEKEKED